MRKFQFRSQIDYPSFYFTGKQVINYGKTLHKISIFPNYI